MKAENTYPQLVEAKAKLEQLACSSGYTRIGFCVAPDKSFSENDMILAVTNFFEAAQEKRNFVEADFSHLI